jgi:methyl-accepting chemotaxis protein
MKTTERILKEFSNDMYDKNISIEQICEEISQINDSLIILKQSGLKKKELEREQERFLLEQKRAKERELQLQKESREKLVTEAQGHLEAFVDISIRNNNVTSKISTESYELEKTAESSLQVAAAINEMRATIEDINGMTKNIAEETVSNVSVAHDAMNNVDKIVDTMNRIETSSDNLKNNIYALNPVINEINSMVDDISEIAQQTNVLALNATVEAARSGEAGKGFAIVAAEVKNLATTTAEVTARISNSIKKLYDGMNSVGESITESGEAVIEGREMALTVNGAVSQVCDSIGAINDRISEISNLLGQQTTVTNDINIMISDLSEKCVHALEVMKNIYDFIEVTSKTIDNRINIFNDLQTDLSLIELAKNDHSKFRTKILGSIMGREHWENHDIPSTKNCRLGNWYYQSAPATIKGTREFRELEELHAQVHNITEEILSDIEANKRGVALEKMTKFNDAFQKVIVTLDKLKSFC